MLVDLLVAIQDHPNYAKTRLEGPANMTLTNINVFLEKLNHKGFIAIVSLRRKGTTKPVLTEKGRDWLRRARALLKQIT